ncbi:universal stress protein [Peterkaempfera griseoplana]|uniref:universal stress protein n=1 Tax=Peterkaempfera griseoplana TaxID=66896 RepID=UPI0006E21E05|nr:universal stress protein [Peterkaempfera griseoplana]
MDADNAGAHRIVVGVSGSLGSLAALHHAVDRARRTGAEVLAVLAWEPPGGEFGYRRTPCPPLLETCRGLAEERLRTVVETAFACRPPDVRLGTLVAYGRPAEVLVRTADRGDDLLVVGRGPSGLLRRMLHRPVMPVCVAYASCPVLVVPRPPLLRDLEAVHRRNTWRLPVEAGELGGKPGGRARR